MSNNKSQSFKNIAMFPLEIIVLPGEMRYLHIFEERYKNLYNDVQKKGGYFVIPFYFQGKLFDTGSLVYIEKTLNIYKSGEIDITVRGAELVNINNFNGSGKRLYPVGDAETESLKEVSLSERTEEVFRKYLSLMKYNDNQISMDLFTVLRFLKLNDIEKFYVVRLKNSETINRTLINFLNLKSLLVKQYSVLQDNYSLN
ncbi:MAG: LON peptidase substrate-binding domain-containing protein [Ignavibacteria bacterium]|nr:LON peptidase substrate-binding domain-containing protein [Ignavibacteria bacterium]